MWRVLHVLSLLAPAAAWANLPIALDGALPCPECRTHFHEWVVAQPLDVSVATGPRDWVAALHNDVNTRLSRPTWTMTEVLAAYGTLTRADAVAALAAVRDMIGSVGLAALDALIAATP
jgi:aspartate aminotransferase-like enzyme